jgi:ferredoxin
MTGSLKLALGRSGDEADPRLRVDWPQCKAHGLCSELAPEVIHLDEWGYPFIDQNTLVGEGLAAVRKAVQACPTLALKLVDAPRR